jgi:hypothetical protein
MGRLNLARSIAGAIVLCVGSPVPASAVEIGLFSWQPDAGGVDFTFAVDVFPEWPDELVLENVFVDFTRSDGTAAQGFFGAYSFDSLSSACVGEAIDVGVATGSLQAPGFGAEPESCDALQPLPQDIVSAALNFSFDATLGTVTVESFGFLFDEFGQLFDARLILFEPAPPAAVPEPSTLFLLSTVVVGWGGRRILERRGATTGGGR